MPMRPPATAFRAEHTRMTRRIAREEEDAMSGAVLHSTLNDGTQTADQRPHRFCRVTAPSCCMQHARSQGAAARPRIDSQRQSERWRRTSVASFVASSSVAGFIFQLPAIQYFRSPPRRRMGIPAHGPRASAAPTMSGRADATGCGHCIREQGATGRWGRGAAPCGSGMALAAPAAQAAKMAELRTNMAAAERRLAARCPLGPSRIHKRETRSSW